MIDLNDDRIEGLDELEWSLRASWNRWKKRIKNAVRHSKPWRYTPAYWYGKLAMKGVKTIKKTGLYKYTPPYLAGKTLARLTTRKKRPAGYSMPAPVPVTPMPVAPVQKEKRIVRGDGIIKYLPLLLIPFLL